MNSLSRLALEHARDALSAALSCPKNPPPVPVVAGIGAALIVVAQAINKHTNAHGVVDFYRLVDARRGLELARSLLEYGRDAAMLVDHPDWSVVGELHQVIEAYLASEAPDLTIPGMLATLRNNGLHAEAAEFDRLLTAVGAGGVNSSPLRPSSINDGQGHGHVKPRPDGAVARCGGPAMCSMCRMEQQAL